MEPCDFCKKLVTTNPRRTALGVVEVAGLGKHWILLWLCPACSETYEAAKIRQSPRQQGAPSA